MGSIRILPDQVVSKIAAGEIVERPASVVKELIENSLDAGAKKIIINLLIGGKRLISIEDNGTGMSKDDALMSIERHATSKIRSADDIENILTLGFRGEALPSISSVSRFEMTTKTRDEISGTRIIIEGGILKKVQESGCPDGTLIEVKNLFYNIPPRMKFLRKTETEMSNIIDIVQRHAISSFNVAFEVTHNDRSVLSLGSDKSQDERLKQIFTRAKLYYLEHEEQGCRISGYLTGPDDSISTTYKIFTYVNGRPVKDRFIIRNILSAYGRILDKGRYPQGVLFIDTGTGSVDINVHPTKSEVRFQNASFISGMIQKSILSMLEKGPWIKTLGTRSESFVKDTPDNINIEHPWTFVSKTNEDFKAFKEPYPGYTRNNIAGRLSSNDAKFTESNKDSEIFPNRGFFGNLDIVGQMGDSYFVCQSPKGLMLIDQHAAHERINYEKFKKQFHSGQLEIQNFLVPLSLEFSAHESSVIEDNLELFHKFGIELSKFGNNSFLLRAAPALLKNADFNTIIIDVVGEISIHNKQEKLEKIFNNLIATIACHSSVTANQKMDNFKIRYMLEELDKTDLPYFCPHGRPVYKEFTYDELERFFKRT